MSFTKEQRIVNSMMGSTKQERSQPVVNKDTEGFVLPNLSEIHKAPGLWEIGNILYVNENDGKVGIGTSSPGRQLEVSSTADSLIRISADTDNDGSNNDAAIEFYNDGSLQYSMGHDNTDDFFKIAGGTLAAAPYLTIDNTGNVGIGTSSPGNKLHIKSAGVSTQSLKIESGADTDRLVQFGEDSGGNAEMWMFGAGDATKIYFSTNSSSYFNGGNVGIGTTTPSSKLEVNGDVEFSGTLLANNTTYGTFSLTGGEEALIPQGVYFIHSQATTGGINTVIEFYDGSSVWYSQAMGGIVISDGTNFKIWNTDASSRVFPYRKLG